MLLFLLTIFGLQLMKFLWNSSKLSVHCSLLYW